MASPVAVAWDTTSAARLRPDSAAHELALTQWRAADPMAVTATTLMEIEYGLAKLAKSKPAAAVQSDWLDAEIDAGVVVVLDFNERAASITGALRAAQPAPPTTGRRPRDRSKANNRIAWICDLQTAATAYAHGYALASADAHHVAIVGLLATIAPGTPALRVVVPPV